ncbi:MAG: response regulator transcription factor [Bacillota bacterium]|nr:response regulator transcription factor [Bacillota bacterium]
MYKIFIVEDDATIGGLLCRHLEKWGYEAAAPRDFNDIVGEFKEYQPDLVLLDISLPFFNGYYWCGEIRKISRVPIIFLSSHTENMDIVMAMNMGGDDYLTKPFSLEVVVAKIQALLRRAYDFGSDGDIITVQGLSLDLNSTTVSYGEEERELTKNEFRLLRLLLINRNKVVSRDELIQALWDNNCFVDDNTLTVNINRLRKKLEAMGAPELIETKKGLGYIVMDK